MSNVKNDKDAAQGIPGVINDSADQSGTTVHPDPFSNLEGLRLSQDHLEAVGLRKQLMTVPVRKPSKEWFVRVHPGSDYRLETAVVELKEEGEIYLVDKSLWPELASESTFHYKAFFTAISRPGNVPFLWPVRMPGEDGKLDSWNESATEIATSIATKEWTRCVSNRHLGAYEPQIASASYSWGEPQWPDLPFNELLRLAFKNAFINTLDHPVLRRLRGEE